MNPLLKSEEIEANHVVRSNLVMDAEKAPFESESYPLCFKHEQYHHDIIDYYSTIVYQKGSSFFRGLDQMLGEEVFRNLLRQLIRDFKERNFGEEDFYACAQRVIGEDEHMQVKFELWYKDHIHVKGYTVLKVIQFQYDLANK